MTTISNTPGFEWYQDRHAMIQAICLKVLFEESQRFPTPKCREFLITLKTIRWYAFASDVEIKNLWNTIRDDEWVTDLIVNVTNEIDLRLVINELPRLEELGKAIGQSIDSLRGTGKNNAVDDEFIQRTPAGGMSAFFKENPWLTACYLISKLDLKLIADTMTKTYESVTAKSE